MRGAVTGQQPAASRPVGHSASQPWPEAPIPIPIRSRIRVPSINPKLAIRAKKLSSQKAAAIVVADMEKPLADFMRFSTVFVVIYLVFLYF